MSFTFPPDDNGDVLRKLLLGGDDLSLPRDINFSVVFAEQASAIAFAELMSTEEVRIEIECAAVLPGLPWDVTVTRYMVPDHGAIGDFEEILAGRAVALGGRNDGWGCFGQSPPPVQH